MNLGLFLFSNLSSVLGSKTEWLNTILYENFLIQFDLWSFTKCWIGFALFFLFIRLKAKRPLIWLFSVLVGFELVELIFQSFQFNFFLAENWQNHISDLILGCISGLAGYAFHRFISKHQKLKRLQLVIIAFICGATYSFIWVGFYGYKYNMSFFNTPGINFGAFLFWLAGSWGTIEFFKLVFRKKQWWFRILFTWAIYIFSLFMFEYIAYNLVEIHEVSRDGENPLIFDLIHGTWYLHVVYLTQPLTSIGLYLGLSKLVMNKSDFHSSSST